METVVLRSAHLTLRNLRESDFDAVLAYRSDRDVCRYIGETMSPEEVTAHIDRCKGGWSRKEGETLNLAVELQGEGLVVGEGLIRYISVKQRQAEFGLALIPRPMRMGLSRVRGILGLETLLTLLRHCFEDLGIHRMIGLVDTDNEASIRLAERTGLHREGTLRKNVLRGGEWRNEHLMSLLEDEWPAVKDRFRDLLTAS